MKSIGASCLSIVSSRARQLSSTSAVERLFVRMFIVREDQFEGSFGC